MKYFREAVFTTIFTLLLLGLIIHIPLGNLLLPVQKMIQDFELTDIVFSKMRENNNYDNRITLVNIGFLDRAKIAEQIEIINQYNPKVVGIDAIFRGNQGSAADSLLAESLSKVKNLVLVSELYRNKVSGTYDSIVTSHPMFLKNANTGFADIRCEVNDAFTTTRTCMADVHIKDSIALSFTTLLASFYDLKAANSYLERNNSSEIINFQSAKDIMQDNELYSNRPVAIDGDQLLSGDFDGESLIKGKIVILGFMGKDFNDPIAIDKYFTPVNNNYIGKTYPDMFGVVIHANIVSMILKGTFINHLPEQWNLPISILIVFLNIWLLTFCYYRFHEYYDSISTLIIFSEILFLILLVLVSFEYNNFKFDSLTAIIGIFFSGYALKLYQGIVPLIYNFIRRRFIRVFESSKTIDEKLEESSVNTNP